MDQATGRVGTRGKEEKIYILVSASHALPSTPQGFCNPYHFLSDKRTRSQCLGFDPGSGQSP